MIIFQGISFQRKFDVTLSIYQLWQSWISKKSKMEKFDPFLEIQVEIFWINNRIYCNTICCCFFQFYIRENFTYYSVTFDSDTDQMF